MIEAIICLFFGLTSILFIGIPFSYMVLAKDDQSTVSSNKFWAYAIMGGFSLLCTVIKILFILDVPVNRYGRLLYCCSLICFTVFLYVKRKNKLLYSCLWNPIINISTILVYILSSIAYVAFGARFYKAYALWDIYYYTAQAEAVKNIPFSDWSKLVYQQPWMLGTVSYTSGVHRISCGAIAAYIAALSGVDGASAMGCMISLSSLMLFATLLYVSENMFSSKMKHCFCCLVAVMIPGIVVAQLECFIPVALFMSFIVFYVRCFFDLYDNTNYRIVLLLGIVFSTGMTLLLDGTYLLLGLIIISFFWKLNCGIEKKNTRAIRYLISVILILVIGIFLNKSYLPYVLEEFRWDMGREHLNGIYGFAYTLGALNWLFYGELLWKLSDLSVTILTFLSVVLFLSGICGLVIQTIRKHDGICLNFLAVFFASILFAAQPGEHQYAFYKVLHFSFAPLILGIALFIKSICIELENKGAFFKTYNILLKAGMGIVLSFCLCCSIVKMLGVFKPFENYAGRVVGKEFVISEAAQDIFEEIEESEDPLLLVCSDRESEIGLWWAFYYGRGKDVHVLAEAELQHFLLDKDVTQMSYLLPDSNCRIIRVGKDNDVIFQEDKKEDYAAILEIINENGKRDIADYENYQNETSSIYELNVFARKKAQARFYCTVLADAATDISCGKNTQNIGTEVKNIYFDIDLAEGINKFALENSCSVQYQILSWNIEILED